MKDLIITSLEGYEIDKENSSFEKIIFKKKNTYKPISWEEFCEYTPVMNEYLINSDSSIFASGLYSKDRKETYDKNLCKTEEEAQAFLALIQLRRLWWEWKDEKNKYAMKYSFSLRASNDWQINVGGDKTVFPCYFYSEETAKNFLKVFKDLFDKVKVLFK